MPTVICPNGHVTHWRNRIGSRAPQLCEECGGKNSRAVPQYEWDDAGNFTKVSYVVAPKRETRTKVECFVCHHLGFAPSTVMKQYDRDMEVYNDRGWSSATTQVPAGTWVCWHHAVVAKNGGECE